MKTPDLIEGARAQILADGSWMRRQLVACVDVLEGADLELAARYVRQALKELGRAAMDARAPAWLDAWETDPKEPRWTLTDPKGEVAAVVTGDVNGYRWDVCDGTAGFTLERLSAKERARAGVLAYLERKEDR